MRSILAPIIGLAIVAAVVAIVALGIRGPQVPALHGLTLERAQAALRSAEFTTGLVSYDDTSMEPTWTVIRQSMSGPPARKGTSVDLVLAGALPARVPDVSGMTVTQAETALRGARLATPTIEMRTDASTPAGKTLSQEPAPGSVVMSGSAVALLVSRGPAGAPTDTVLMKVVKKFGGAYSPKSVVATQKGLVFAQNMIYRHTISVFDDTSYEPVKTISDRVTLSKFGFPEYTGSVQGGPVESAVTPDGTYMYVSQYSMYGPGFSHPGDDDLGPGSGVDPSFVYRVSTRTLKIDQVIKVGSVPKYVAVTPDGRYVLVTNWVSFTMSVIDTTQGRVVKTITLGRHPRGIAVDSTSETAYVAIMGSSDVAKVRLSDFQVSWIKGVGSSPRHLVISSDDRFLYATLNGSGQVAKIDLATHRVVGRVTTGKQPRSMTISEDGRSIYVVNYESDSVSKVRTADMTEIQKVAVGRHPIGITYVNARREVWVCCYSGVFYILRDELRAP